MPSTAERRGDGSHVSPIFPRAHAVIAASIAIVPHDAERMFPGQAFADLTRQDRAVDRWHDGSVKVDQHRLRRKFAHELVFITQDGPAFLLQLLLLELTPEVIYRPPDQHPRITAAELDLIRAERGDSSSRPVSGTSPRLKDLLKLPQTWGIIIAKTFSDPVWFFVTDWFPIYLVAKGIDLRSGLVAVWVPFIAADIGNVFSGWLSGYLIKSGWSLGAARKALVVFGGVGVTLLIPTILTTNLYLITLLFALSTFAYACFTTMANVLPSDVYNNESVASVSGLSGTGAGIGTIIAFKLVGHFSDVRQAAATHAFDPILIVAGLVPLVGMVLVLILVRNTTATDEGLVREI